jgi:hypothetical protein
MFGSVNSESDRIARAIRSAYCDAAALWNGCDWPTQWGKSRLNLQGMSSSQATILARATAGAERASWRVAAHWLRQVEETAREARQEAEQAAELTEAGQFEGALAHAKRAVALEATYRTPVVWRSFADSVESAILAIAKSSGVHDQPPTSLSRGEWRETPDTAA